MYRLLLTPRTSMAYGQDFLLGEDMESINVFRRFPSEKGYDVSLSDVGLVISHNPDDPHDSAFVSALPLSMPVITHLHLQWGYIEGERKEWAQRSIRRASVGVVPTEFMRCALRAQFSEIDWKVIKYGLNGNRFTPALTQDRNKFRQRYSIQDDELLLIHVGRLEKSKGLQVLTHFVKGLDSLTTRTRLVLQFLANSQNATITNYRRSAESLVALSPQNVLLLPDLDPLSDRPLKYCDLLITTSLREVCPLVVLEAFLAGIPVLALNATPFYAELSDTYIQPGYYNIIPLPERFDDADLPRSKLFLSEYESDYLAQQLLSFCEGWSQPYDVARVILSRQAIESGFTLPRMLRDFDTLYAQYSLAD